MFNIDVSGNVPLYGQEKCNYCGAASGQMTMNGYPDPAHRLFFTQLTIWNSIQVRNSSNPADVASSWATDPFGLRDCMMDMNTPPGGGHWVVFSQASRDQLMFWILYWMNKNHYPVPVLINKGGHWVVIVGYQTDVAPVPGSSPILQQIRFFDPEPHNVGTDTTQAAATWYGTPFNGAIQYSGTWLNNYVAVIEPPQGKEQIKVVEEKRTGTKFISPTSAVEYAMRWIKELHLAEKYPILKEPRLKNIAPLVVREEINIKSRLKNVPYYYIVPFGIEGEIRERLARFVVIVNAFTGKFEEVTAFGKPMRYLGEEDAINIVAKATDAGSRKLKNAKNILVELVFTPSDITHIRVFPFWKITIGERIVYLDQLGTIYGKLLPSVPGD